MGRPPTLTTCDICGGPAHWTVHRDVVYYHCDGLCDGFMQHDLFGDSDLVDLRADDEIVRLDMPISVSGLDEDETADPTNDVLSSKSEGLPF